MDFVLPHKFIKRLTKLPSSVVKSFRQKSEVFRQNPHDPVLNFHALKGDKGGFFSINITGDYRATFKIKENVAVFYKIGRHSELYNK